MKTQKFYQKYFFLNLAVVIAVAFNLRAPITSIGPVVSDIKNFYELSSTSAGMLTTLPLIAFGTISFLVGYFRALPAMVTALICLAFGEILRSFGGTFGLFAGMGLIGCAIAVANVLLPSFIKKKFPQKAAFVMGIYGLMLSVSSIAGIALCIPLLRYFGLPLSMLFWLVFALLALAIYHPQTRNGRFGRKKAKQSSKKAVFRYPTTWFITLFMGLQSFVAYALFAWLVEFIAEKGVSIDDATKIVVVSQFVSIPIALLSPLLLSKIAEKFRGYFVAFLASLYGLMLLALLYASKLSAIWVIVVILGMPWGGVFSLALLFIATKSTDAIAAAKLSAFAQGTGYIIAAQSPWLIGYLHDTFGNFTSSIWLLAVVSFLQAFFGYLAYKGKMVG